MKSALIGLITFIAIFPAVCIEAHEVRPAYLEIKQTAVETFDVFWKVPGQGDMRLGLYLKLPQNCKPVSLPKQYGTGDAFIEQWTLRCQGALAGETILVEGLSTTMTDVLVRFEHLDGVIQATRLSPATPSLVVEAAPSPFQVSVTYLHLGIEHILLGVDHLLFVLALIVLVKGWRRLVGTISAFTVAHSITLAAATLGFVSVPTAPVEAVIALSIAFVACEIIHRRQGRSGLTERWPWMISFTFGLLHGFGFASALNQVGLPQNAIPIALLFFNVGVEIGQLLFIASVMSLIRGIAITSKKLGVGSKPSFANAWEFTTAYAIGSVAIFWLIERTLAFL
jgi:hydrogenase/urease accessory protein HupE